MNVNESQYLAAMVSKYEVDNLEIYRDEIAVQDFEREIPAERFPRTFHTRPGATYTRTVIKYFLPFSGDQGLLHCAPSTRLMWTDRVTVEDGCICFEVVDFWGEAEKIQHTARGYIDPIIKQAQNVQKQVDAYNGSLEAFVRGVFQARKQQLLKKNDLVANLGVPVRKKENTPDTFSIPNPAIRKKVCVSKPHVSEKGYKPEPALDESTYREILRIINDVGRQFERMPSTYSDKSEEDLRDHFLLMLEPNFEGSATGETFNKTGKTDILLRYEGSNVFIAECKFWTGAKGFLKTITQLLAYLTWRDSKAAIILFVPNKDFSVVLNQIEDVASGHPNFLGSRGKHDESWFQFRFHLNGDPNREVLTAVLLYHLPL